MFPLDRQVLSQAIASILDEYPIPSDNDETDEKLLGTDEERQRRKLAKIRDEDWDLFLRIMKDGSIVIRGVAVRSCLYHLSLVLNGLQNIDRRPPTLLKQFTLLHTPPSTVNLSSLPTQLLLSSFLPDRDEKGYSSRMTLTTCPPLAAHDIDPLALFDAQKRGSVRVTTNDHESYRSRTSEGEIIEKFVRTPDGRGVAVLRASGGEAWAVTGHHESIRLRRVGRWHSKGAMAILDGGM